jgi:uncharacterized protein
MKTGQNNGSTGKKALVTGASSGIGYAFAQALASLGYRVTCVARSENKLKQLVVSMGMHHRVMAADLTDAGQLAMVLNDIEENRYDLVVNNAGYAIYDRFENVPVEKHEDVIALNVLALMRISYAFVKGARAGNAMINVSSALSRLAYPGGAVYCGTKGFVTAFTESLWYEYKDRDVYIMALLPGSTDTRFHDRALGDRPVEKPKGQNTPEKVVSEAIEALNARSKPFLISGPKFRRMTMLATRLMPRKKMIEIMGKRSMGLQGLS